MFVIRDTPAHYVMPALRDLETMGLANVIPKFLVSTAHNRATLAFATRPMQVLYVIVALMVMVFMERINAIQL